MASFLLDTSVIIDALNGKRARRELLLDLLRQGHLLACCSINVTEIYAGMRPKEEKATEEFLTSLEFHHVSWPVARLAGLLKRDHAKNGQTLTVADATIAAVALAHELTLPDRQRQGLPDQGPAALPAPVGSVATHASPVRRCPGCEVNPVRSPGTSESNLVVPTGSRMTGTDWNINRPSDYDCDPYPVPIQVLEVVVAWRC
ncbi:MAG: PIN domain-containing protein [Vicinamibacterales bacterium]